MKHIQHANASYLLEEDYYNGGGYLGYGGYKDTEGCRRLFFVILTVIVLVVAGIASAILF